MSLGLALPSRPRAIRVVGGPAKISGLGHGGRADGCSQPASDRASWTAALNRFVGDEPAHALDVLENWLTAGAPKDGEMHHARG